MPGPSISGSSTSSLELPARDFTFRSKSAVEASFTVALWEGFVPPPNTVRARTSGPIAAISLNSWVSPSAFSDTGGGSSWNEYGAPGTDYCPFFLSPTTVTPGKHMEAIREGIEEGFASGILAGYPVIKAKAVVEDVQIREEAFELAAFRIAASLALRKCLLQGDAVLLEPVMRVEITTPSEYVGDIIGDLNSRKGRVKSIEDKKEFQILSVGVALSTMFGYLTILRSLSQGRASFSMMFDHYAEVQSS